MRPAPFNSTSRFVRTFDRFDAHRGFVGFLFKV